MRVTDCLDANVLSELADGVVPVGRLPPLEAHLDACRACRTLLAGLSGPEPFGLRSEGPSTLEVLGRAVLGGVALAPGSSLARWRIEGRIGAGGMGVVYAARDAALDRRVAIKVLRPSTDEPTRARASLLREARAMAALEHPNVVSIFDSGADGEIVYLVMEYVEGTTLRAWRGAPIQARLQTLLETAQGLAHAHASGIVHGDFKPDNVLVDARGHPRVADFGLARALPQTTVPTRADAPVAGAGTPAYMAPEVQRGDIPTPASDQFAFCLTAWEVLFGDRPDLGRPARRAGSLRRQRRALTRGLSSDPSARFPSMDLLVEALRPGRARGASVAVAVVLASGAAASAWTLDFLAEPADGVDVESAAELGEVFQQRIDGAKALTETGRRDEGLAALRETYWAAVDAGDEANAAYAASTAAYAMSIHEPEAVEALDWARHAASQLARRGRDPRALARLHHAIGLIYGQRSRWDEAESHHRQAVALLEAEHDPDPASVAMSLSNLALVYHARGAFPEALEAAERSLQLRQRAGASAASPLELAQSYNNVGAILQEMGQYDPALSAHTKAYELRRAEQPGGSVGLVSSMSNLGAVHMLRDDVPEGRRWLLDGLAMAEQVYGAHHRRTALLRTNMAEAYARAGELDAALDALTTARQDLAGTTSPVAAAAAISQASVLLDLGRPDEGRAAVHDALALLSGLAVDHPFAVQAYQTLALVELGAGDVQAAERAMRSAEAGRSMADDHPQRLAGLLRYGRALMGAGHRRLAAPWLRQIIARSGDPKLVQATQALLAAPRGGGVPQTGG